MFHWIIGAALAAGPLMQQAEIRALEREQELWELYIDLGDTKKAFEEVKRYWDKKLQEQRKKLQQQGKLPPPPPPNKPK
jgi:hypothetical protein